MTEDLDFDEIDKELTIDNTSLYNLEQELRNYSRIESKYHRRFAQANKAFNRLTLKLEVLVSTIINEICVASEKNGKVIPATAVGNLKKTKVPLDKRYIDCVKKLIDAQEQLDMCKGLVSSFVAKGYRLGEIVDMERRTYVSDKSLEQRLAETDRRLEEN